MDEKENEVLCPQKPSSVLYKNKTFSACHSHPKIVAFMSKNTASVSDDTITTENVIPHLIKEAERDIETDAAMKSSMQSVKTQRSKKSRWLSAIFLILNLVVLVGIFIWQFLNEPPTSLPELLQSKLNWWWLIVAIGLFFLINFLDSARINLAIKKVSGRSRPHLSYKSIAICRYYDALTPLATGGQPFQVYYLNKRGLNASSATSVPLAKYIYSQVTYILFSLIVLLCGSGFITTSVNPLVMTLCYIGLALNLLLLLAIFFLSISKKVAPRIMFGLLKMLKWMHIIKDSRSLFKKVMRTVKEYVSTFRMFMTSGWLMFFEFLLSIALTLATYSIAFVVYCVFCDFDISLWYTFLTLQLVCDLAISFVPIPGGAGTAEISYSTLFASYYTMAGAGNVFVWAILLYRIMTYYAYLIQGGIILLYDFAIGNKKIEPMLQRFKDEDRRAKENNLLKMLEDSGQLSSKKEDFVEASAEDSKKVDDKLKNKDKIKNKNKSIKKGGN